MLFFVGFQLIYDDLIVNASQDYSTPEKAVLYCSADPFRAVRQLTQNNDHAALTALLSLDTISYQEMAQYLLWTTPRSLYNQLDSFDDSAWLMFHLVCSKTTPEARQLVFGLAEQFINAQRSIPARLFLLSQPDYQLTDLFVQGSIELNDPLLLFALLVRVSSLQLNQEQQSIVIGILDQFRVYKKITGIAKENRKILLGNLSEQVFASSIISASLPSDTLRQIILYANDFDTMEYGQDLSNFFSALAAQLMAGFQIGLTEAQQQKVDQISNEELKTSKIREYLKDLSESVAQTAAAIMSVPSLLDAIVADPEKKANITKALDERWNSFGTDLYTALFHSLWDETGALRVRKETAEWIMHLEFFRRLRFLAGDNATKNWQCSLSFILKANDQMFIEHIFQCNNGCVSRDQEVEYQGSLKVKLEPFPLFRVLTQYKPREEEQELFNQLICRMLNESSFDIANYYSSSVDYFKSLPCVRLLRNLHVFVVGPSEMLSLETNGLPPLTEDELRENSDLLIHNLKFRYSQDIYKLCEQNSALPRFFERLKAIFGLIKSLPPQHRVDLYNTSPHILVLSMTYRIEMLKRGVTNDQKDERKRQRIVFLEEVKRSLSYALDPNPPVMLLILLYLSATQPNQYANLPKTIANLLLEKDQYSDSSEKKKDDSSRSERSLRNIDGEISLYKTSLPAYLSVAQQWFHEVFYLESSSQFQKICETLALLPDDYLAGILDGTGVTIAALRAKAFPGIEVSTYASMINQGLDDSHDGSHDSDSLHLLTRQGSSTSFSSTNEPPLVRRNSLFSSLFVSKGNK